MSETSSTEINHPYANENGVEWKSEAWERIKHAPEFVRPGIRKLMVQRAVMRGYKYITSDFLTEIRNESMMLVSKRVRQFGFEELSMGAFDEAKKTMKESPRKLEVIEENMAGHKLSLQLGSYALVFDNNDTYMLLPDASRVAVPLAVFSFLIENSTVEREKA